MGPWKLDTFPGSGPKWVDVPGERLFAQPNAWTASRYLAEFAVAVEGFPEFGMLYFNVYIDTVPSYYRVRMNDAISITSDQWCAIKNQGTPFQEPKAGALKIDSGWLPGS